VLNNQQERLCVAAALRHVEPTPPTTPDCARLDRVRSQPPSPSSPRATSTGMIDPFLLRVTRGRLAATLFYPTAARERGCEERRARTQRHHLLPRRRAICAGVSGTIGPGWARCDV